MAVDVYVQYGEVKCCVLPHQWLRVTVFSNVYVAFDLLPVDSDGSCELSHEWQQRWTVWFEFCFTWLQEWLGTKFLVCPSGNDIGFCAWVYFHGVSLPIDLDGHHIARIFFLIFCKVVVWHSVCLFHLEINGLSDFCKMSFFVTTKITDGIAGFATTCIWYFLPTIPANFNRFFVSFLKSFPPRGWLFLPSVVGYDIRSNDMTVGVESIVFQEVHFLLHQLQWSSC